ncbi:DUF1918 domain-containing protein [Leifsonia sp. NPDC056665]|uniref:DUF1918 domain-containing protein n=1 Tax=unclassified Leifsonia TaxID=2663824 RepID=UPI0036893FA6
MQATIGDRICIRGTHVESADRWGAVVEVRGPDGGPPFLVRFDDGHETLVYPGTDAVIEHSAA